MTRYQAFHSSCLWIRIYVGHLPRFPTWYLQIIWRGFVIYLHLTGILDDIHVHWLLNSIAVLMEAWPLSKTILKILNSKNNLKPIALIILNNAIGSIEIFLNNAIGFIEIWSIGSKVYTTFLSFDCFSAKIQTLVRSETTYKKCIHILIK